jgi:hypothetical protein
MEFEEWANTEYSSLWERLQKKRRKAKEDAPPQNFRIERAFKA